MPHSVEGVYKRTIMSRWRMMVLGIIPLVLVGLLSFPSPASASTINLNGSAPGIQSMSQFPNYGMWVNTPTEYNVVPQAGGNKSLPGQVVSNKTTYQTVMQPIYGQVAQSGQRWVSSGYTATGQTWVSSGYWATGQTWVSSGYWATGRYWVSSGYWATGQTWVSSGYWGGSWETIIGGYWDWRQVYAIEPNEICIPWTDVCVQNGWRTVFIGWQKSWVTTVNYVWNSYWVNTSHWQSYSYWVNTSHWQSYQYWVDTSHWQSYQYWVDTSHWQSYQYWVDTSHWETYTYYVTEVVGYQAVQVPTVTKVTDSNINVSNETLLGVQPVVKNTSNGQEIYGSFCSTPTTPLIPPTSPEFPDYSAAPWNYASFFSNNNICNINASTLQSGEFDNWATARQSVQLILTPSWSATVSYNKVTTVNGVVTSSVPVTQTETITGTPYTGPTLPTKYLVGVPCAVQNGRSYCPGGPSGGTPISGGS